MSRILVIPDTQVKPDVPTEHLTWLGKYICDIRPDIIVHIGDHFDMPSLSSYDKGTAAIEGKRVKEDIEAGVKGLDLIEAPITSLQRCQMKYKKKIYTPQKVFLLGNHEERLSRYLNHNPELIGMLGYEDFELEKRGWEVHDFLKIVNIDGILFSHYFANPMSGRPYSGKAASLIQRIGKSFVMGHRQELDFTCRELCDGTRQIGIVAGAFYQHDEGYKGYQGNKHWRGVVVLNEAVNGWADPMMVSVDYLYRKYGKGST
jgi:hypothetical protein